MLHRGTRVLGKVATYVCVAVAVQASVSALAADEVSAAGDEAVADDDPAAALDDFFAGQTVADREFGMKLIRERGEKVPRIGQKAPDFELKTADGKQSVRLSSFHGKRPIVLLFGSHT